MGVFCFQTKDKPIKMSESLYQLLYPADELGDGEDEDEEEIYMRRTFVDGKEHLVC